MKKPSFAVAVLATFILFVSGCLSVEKKTYTFQFTGENSGILTIRYHNIISVVDNGEETVEEDFQELLNDYIEGSKTEDEYPDATLVEKRFFEEDDVLCAELVFEFNDLESARLFKYDKKGPFMYCLNCYLETEEYGTSNGSYGGEVMPVVFWESSLKELSLNTMVTPLDETTVSLLPKYKEWKEGQ
jgi:hypothetical protein